MKRLRSRAPAAVGALLALLASLGACRRDVAPRVHPAEAVLARRIEGIRRILADARRGPLVHFEQVLAVVDERLVRDLISSVTPYERIVDDVYRVRVDSAAAEFRAGFALVRLDGRASLVQAPASGVYADVSLYSGLDVLGVDAASGVLRARLHVIAFTARRVGMLGMEPPVRRLVEDLTREGLREFEVFNSDLQIPVRLEETVELPAVDAGDEDDRVRIPAADLPLRVSVQDVKVVAGKLWIPIGVAVLPRGVEPAGSPFHVDSGAPRGKGGGDPAGGRGLAEQGAGSWSPGLAAFALLGLGAPLAGQRDSATARVAGLRATYQALQDSLLAVTAPDSLLQRAAADSNDVALAVRPELLERLATEVAANYLDQVELDLTPEKPVDEEKPLKVKTPVGKIKAGDWSVRLSIHRLRGVLSAGTPRLTFTGANRVHLQLPVAIQRGKGTGTIDFAWDAKSLVELVCDDFATTLDIAGVVLPDRYEVNGDYALAAEGETIVARPEFPRDKFRIKVDLTPESWAKVRAVLESQNESGKCAAIDVDKLTQKLEEVGQKGFNVKIPRSILKTVEIPAGLSESVEVENRSIQLSVLPDALRATPSALWYTATVRAEPAAPSAAAPARTDSSAGRGR